MSDAVQVPESNVGSQFQKINGDSLDLDAIRELSSWETQKEEKAKPQEAKSQPKKVAAPVKETEAEEAPEAEAEGEPLEEVTEEVVEEKVEEESSESETPVEEDPEEGKSSKYLTAKSGEKTYKVPKDALFDVKVDGEVQQLTAQELINKASAGVHYDKELSNLGREKKTFKEQKEKFDSEARQVNENAQMLLDLAQNGDPEEFVSYFAALKGEDPDKVMDDMIQRVAQYVEQFSQMTEREIKLYRENRKYKFQQTLNKRRETQSESKRKQEQETQQIVTELEREGLTKDDFFAAADEVKQRIADGEMDGNITADDIVDYAVKKRLEVKVESAIKAVNKGLLSDQTFVKRVRMAVAATENQTGERMTPKEVQALIASASEMERKSISESLSKKVQRHEKSGKTNSQSASSRKQESTGPLTLNDHWSRFDND